MGAAPSAWVPPETFEEYRLVRQLGRGGMGQVYVAHDTLLDRAVAVKFIASAVARSEAARQRFLIEARAAARLHHPNVVAIYRVGELDGLPYLVSELVRGKSLDRIDRPVEWTRLLEIAIGLARGLAAAHRRGVLHRDLKPANAVLAETGEVKLLDFGLAKLLEPEGEVIAIAGAAPAPLPATDDPEATLPTPQPPAPVPALDVTAMPDGTPPAASGASGVTVAGALMGTPAYMSPEAWRGQPATARSDVYSLGVLLFELASGRPPHLAESAAQLGVIVIDTDAPPLASRASGIDARFAAVVDRCLRRDPAARFPAGDEVRDALEQIAVAPASAARPAGNPYRGLAAFEAEHRALFFGRDAAIRGVVERLVTDPFVLVTGDSGVGKSSLCRAGVLPRVLDGALGARTFRAVTVLPGRSPLAALTTALAPIVGEDERDAMATSEADDPDELARRIRHKLGKTQGLIVFVDQLEELITLAEPGKARAAAAVLVALAAQGPQIRVLATVRGDYLTRLTTLPVLAPEIERAIYLLAPLGKDAIREVIVGPANATGVRFESPALIDRLVGTTASLPLLQFALADLWDARDPASATITAASLTAIGGVEGALTRHADQVIASMLPGSRAAARRVLVRLVTAEGTRARRTADELVGEDPDARTALEALVRGRLVVAREDAYEVAHEALLASWDTLRGWLDDEGDRRAIEQRLDAASAEWQRLGRPRDALWSRRRLDEASALPADELRPVAREFLAASRRAARIRLGLSIGLPALVVLAGALGYLALRADQARTTRARVATHLAEADREVARASEIATQVDALRTSAFGRFDSSDTAKAEEEWAEAIRLQAEVDHARSAASQALEAALIVDASRGDVRDRLAEMLYLRALDAERWHRPSEDLIQRLRLHDRRGEHQRAWNAAASLSVTTIPPSKARVELLRFVTDDHGVRSPMPVRDLGLTPVASIELPRGSYLLRLTLEDGRVQPYPLLLERADVVSAEIALLPTSIPEGFAFVPAGDMLFGSDAHEDVRKNFFSTHAQHRRHVGSFLIATHETTYAEWIAFLEDLPSDERERRRPQGGTYTPGSVNLTLVQGKWTLTLQPTSEAYVATFGTPIRYPGRTARAQQDWLRMPVSGISLDDARAYASWLDKTGRLPRARLCHELEWERAARGADDRQYPHGDAVSLDEANIDETYGRDPLGFGPDEVGSHPHSNSAFGVMDLVGNVWEWVESDEAYNVRGGAYYFDRMTARSVNRYVGEPTMRECVVGMRICASP